MPCERIEIPATLDAPCGVMFLCGRGRRRAPAGAVVPRPAWRDVDDSASLAWACRTCAHRHRPGSPCPPAGVWLVLSMCMHCLPRLGRYCSAHDTGRK